MVVDGYCQNSVDIYFLLEFPLHFFEQLYRRKEAFIRLNSRAGLLFPLHVWVKIIVSLRCASERGVARGVDEERDMDSENPQFYDVEKFKIMVEAQKSVTPSKGPRLILVLLQSFLDSVDRFLSTFFFMTLLFAA